MQKETGATPGSEKTWADPRRTKSTGGASRTKKWLNIYRVTSLALLMAILAVVCVNTSKVSDVSTRSFAPISVEQADKVKTAAAFLQAVGFNNPTYKGITPGVEGEYPTFTATAIGGQPVDLWIRTTRNGGLEIQPVGIFESIKSADDLATIAAHAVYSWQNLPADASASDRETKKYDFDRLGKYNPSQAYLNLPFGDESNGWPRK